MAEPETPEQFERRIADAQAAHAKADRDAVAMFPAVVTLASEALKAAALVNGGSAAAMLAFIGTGRQPVTPDTIWGLKVFGFGLIASAVATAFAYLAQYSYLGEIRVVERTWTHPYFGAVRASRAYRRAAIDFHAAGLLLVLGAYGCAAVGLIDIAGTLVPMPAKVTTP